jgi:hypothetical protein
MKRQHPFYAAQSASHSIWRMTRETLLVAASVLWCAVLACGLLYIILIAAP